MLLSARGPRGGPKTADGSILFFFRRRPHTGENKKPPMEIPRLALDIARYRVEAS